MQVKKMLFLGGPNKYNPTIFDIQGIEVSLTKAETHDLVASMRHVLSGGSPSFNEATPMIEFMMQLLRTLDEFTKSEVTPDPSR